MLTCILVTLVALIALDRTLYLCDLVAEIIREQRGQ